MTRASLEAIAADLGPWALVSLHFSRFGELVSLGAECTTIAGSSHLRMVDIAVLQIGNVRFSCARRERDINAADFARLLGRGAGRGQVGGDGNG